MEVLVFARHVAASQLCSEYDAKAAQLSNAVE